MEHNHLPNPRRGQQRRAEAPRNETNIVAGAAAERNPQILGEGRSQRGAQWPPIRHLQGVGIGPQGQNVIGDGSDSSGSSKGAALSSLSSSEYSKACKPPPQQGFQHGGGGGGGADFQEPSCQPGAGAKSQSGGNSVDVCLNDPSGAMAAVAAIMMQQPKAAAAAVAALQQQLVGMTGGNSNSSGNGFVSNIEQATQPMQNSVQLQILQTALSQALQQNLWATGAPGSSNEANTGNLNNLLLQQVAKLQNHGMLQGTIPSSTNMNQVGSVGQDSVPLVTTAQQAPSFLQQTVSNASSLNRMRFGSAPSHIPGTHVKRDNHTPKSGAVCKQGPRSAGVIAESAATGTTVTGAAIMGTRGESRNGTPDLKKNESLARNAPVSSASGKVRQSGSGPEAHVELRREPCLARKMSMDHNAETAYFEVSDKTEHEEELLCSHASCRHSGIKFLWCGYCEAPAYKRGFSKRHTHTGEVMPREVRRIQRKEQEERRKLKKLEHKENYRNRQHQKKCQDEKADSNTTLSESLSDPSKGEDRPENDSSNAETNETSGNDESPQSSEFSSDLDENLPKKKRSAPSLNRTTEKGQTQPGGDTDDARHSSKKHKEYYTVSFVDRRATGENIANGSALGTDTAMSSLSSASEHFTDARHRPDHTPSNKRKREDFNEEEEGGTASSVSSMDEEGLSHFNSSAPPQRAAECAAIKGTDPAVAASLMPLADAAAAALKTDEEEASSMTSSTRAVKLPRLGNENHLRELDSDKKLDRDASLEDNENRGSYWTAAKNAVSVAARISESQSQSRSHSSSTTPHPVSSAAGSGSNTGSGKAEGSGSGSNSANSSSGQGFASGSGTSESDEIDDVRREEWARMLRLRPPSSDAEAMTGWLIQLLETSDPSNIQGRKADEQGLDLKLTK